MMILAMIIVPFHCLPVTSPQSLLVITVISYVLNPILILKVTLESGTFLIPTLFIYLLTYLLLINEFFK